MLDGSVKAQMDKAELPQRLMEQFPYSVWAIDELEVGLQICRDQEFYGWEAREHVNEFLWDWHGYISNTYASFYPFKALFDDEYDEMFTELYSAQVA
jgi:hypothetical protein